LGHRAWSLDGEATPAIADDFGGAMVEVGELRRFALRSAVVAEVAQALLGVVVRTATRLVAGGYRDEDLLPLPRVTAVRGDESVAGLLVGSAVGAVPPLRGRPAIGARRPGVDDPGLVGLRTGREPLDLEGARLAAAADAVLPLLLEVALDLEGGGGPDPLGREPPEGPHPGEQLRRLD